MFAYLIDRANVGVIQRGRSTGFTVESDQCLWVGGELIRKELQRDKATERSVLRFIDNTHTTAAKFINDVVLRNGVADKRGRVCHQVVILGWAKKQVNEARWATG